MLGNYTAGSAFVRAGRSGDRPLSPALVRGHTDTRAHAARAWKQLRLVTREEAAWAPAGRAEAKLPAVSAVLPWSREDDQAASARSLQTPYRERARVRAAFLAAAERCDVERRRALERACLASAGDDAAA